MDQESHLSWKPQEATPDVKSLSRDESAANHHFLYVKRTDISPAECFQVFLARSRNKLAVNILAGFDFVLHQLDSSSIELNLDGAIRLMICLGTLECRKYVLFSSRPSCISRAPHFASSLRWLWLAQYTREECTYVSEQASCLSHCTCIESYTSHSRSTLLTSRFC